MAYVTVESGTNGVMSALPEGHAAQMPTYRHLVLKPLDRSANGGDHNWDSCPDVLLAIFPGAMLPPSAFSALARAIQQAASQAINDHNVHYQLLQQMLSQAEEEGFVLHRDAPGAAPSNLMLAFQSAGCLGFRRVAAQVAVPAILLAAAPNMPDYARMNVINLEAWPLPLMILVGELDGQMRWPKFSSYVAEAAAMAVKFGPGYTAVHKPVVVVGGVNHGNTSNGEPRLMRGDVVRGVHDYAKCMQLIGGLMAAFINFHLSESESVRGKAKLELVDALRDSLQLTGPYCASRGLGDTAAAFAAAAATGDTRPAGVVGITSGLVAGAQRAAGHAETVSLPPGEVLSAEAHAARLQRRVLASLPAEQLGRLTVAATAHVHVDTFSRSRVMMEPLGADRWLLHVHVLLYYRALEVPDLYLAPQAPYYALKLKCARFVAAVLGLPDPEQYGTPPPAELNRVALEAALEAAPPAIVKRYLELGRKMEFKGDVDVASLNRKPAQVNADAKTVEAFLRDHRIAFHFPTKPGDTAPQSMGSPAAAIAPAVDKAVKPGSAAPDGPVGGGSGSAPVVVAIAVTTAVAPQPPPSLPGKMQPPAAFMASVADPGGALAAVRVSSPFLCVPPSPDMVASRDRGAVRQLGDLYVKVLSVAAAMEWVWLDCLRFVESPW